MLLAFSAVLLLIATAGSALLLVGNRQVRQLGDVPPALPSPPPSLSIVVAARDEAHTVEPAMRSLLALDYPDLEIIAVDDRSADGTGQILDRLSAAEPRLHVIHVPELPDGWLGKNHALQQGADSASGALILFTDADVVFAPTALSRAVAFLDREALDHLAVSPELRMPGVLLGIFGAMFAATFGLFMQPWKARRPGRYHIGIGAFNLVRADVYRAVGGHAPLALRPDDDVKLGKLIKKSGFRQDVLFGVDQVVVEWYSSIGEVVRGLRKNSFAGVDYRLYMIMGGAFMQIALHVYPIVALLFVSGTVWWVCLAIAIVLLVGYVDNARIHGYPAWYGAGYPLFAVLFSYTIIAATLRTLVRGGIEWRGTFYPLERLRRNVV